MALLVVLPPLSIARYPFRVSRVLFRLKFSHCNFSSCLRVSVRPPNYSSSEAHLIVHFNSYLQFKLIYFVLACFSDLLAGIRLICTGNINNSLRDVSIAKAQHNNISYGCSRVNNFSPKSQLSLTHRKIGPIRTVVSV